MFHKDTLDAFRQGTLQLWCPKMVLRQEGTDTPSVDIGSGVIRQDAERVLQFILLESTPVSVADNMRRFANRMHTQKVGKLLPDDMYYSLEATDTNNVSWRSQRLRVHHSSGLGGSAISGRILLLEHEEPSTRHVSPLHVEIRDDTIDLPFNAITTIESAIAINKETKLPRGSSSSRNVAKVTVGNYDFLLLKENGILSVDASAKDSIYPEHFEIRILEALQFVTGRTLLWAIMTKARGQNTVTCLRSTEANESERSTPPPIAYSHDISGNWIWTLFDKYLDHVLTFKPDNRFVVHPLSAWMNSVRDAHMGSTFSRGLALGVAVEGILEAEYCDAGHPSVAQTEAVKAMIAHVQLFKESETIQNRTIGALRSMQQSRAKDKLLALQASGVVRPDDVRAWDAIRNRGAHARPPEDNEIQEWFDNCSKIEVLICHLIFHAIGYEGRFTDYSSEGWPIGQYPCSQP